MMMTSPAPPAIKTEEEIAREARMARLAADEEALRRKTAPDEINAKRVLAATNETLRQRRPVRRTARHDETGAAHKKKRPWPIGHDSSITGACGGSREP
ncbi:hypothetical protein PWT90_11090 [Aphanocladium album]|nr:hypothetical protein PWT90_11090 [Aphanocladium album]